MTVRKILCVDDEADVLAALQRLFLDDGYGILTATSGEQGLQLLQSGAVDLVIADYRMSGMTGHELLCRVNELHPQTMGIVLSGFAEASAVADLLERGIAFTFVAKPWKDDELRVIVRRALEHGQIRREMALQRESLERTQQELRVVHSLPLGLIAIDAQGIIRLSIQPDTFGASLLQSPRVGSHFSSVLAPAAVTAVEGAMAARSARAVMEERTAPRFTLCLPWGETGTLLISAPGELSTHGRSG